MTKQIQTACLLFLSLLLCGCSTSQGEAIARELCDCHREAGSDLAKQADCVAMQMELQQTLQDDAAETRRYVRTFSKCTAAFGG